MAQGSEVHSPCCDAGRARDRELSVLIHGGLGIDDIGSNICMGGRDLGMLLGVLAHEHCPVGSGGLDRLRPLAQRTYRGTKRGRGARCPGLRQTPLHKLESAPKILNLAVRMAWAGGSCVADMDMGDLGRDERYVEGWQILGRTGYEGSRDQRRQEEDEREGRDEGDERACPTNNDWERGLEEQWDWETKDRLKVAASNGTKLFLVSGRSNVDKSAYCSKHR